MAAVAAILVIASVWSAGLFGTNQAQAREIFLSASGDAGPNRFTDNTTNRNSGSNSKGKSSRQGTTGTVNSPKGVLKISGDQVGLYGGTQNQASCNRTQMIAFLQVNPAKAAAWVAALNSDPSLHWSGGSKLQVAQIPAYIGELTPVLLRLDTRVTNNGYRNGHATPFQAVLQAGTAVLIDTMGVPRARCACGNPLLQPRDLTKPSMYSGTVWPGFTPTTIVTIAPASAPINQVRLVDVSKGTDAAFDRPIGSTGTQDVNVKVTVKIKNELNLGTILAAAQIIAAPPSTEVGSTSTAAGTGSGNETSSSGGSETTASNTETTTSNTEPPSSSTEAPPSSTETTTSNTEPPSSTTEAPPSSIDTTSSADTTTSATTSTAEITTSSETSTSTSGLSSSETTAAAAAIPAVYVETVDPRFPSGHGSRVAFLGTGEKWRQEWTRCDSHHERPDGWSARAV